jgi:Glucose-6-phosphate dehydrogenase subunit N-terminal domain/Glucose-6-phosphate dehydrogenase subunit C-terminal domain
MDGAGASFNNQLTERPKPLDNAIIMTESQVKIADIDSELKKLLQESKKLGKIRACLFNLVIFTQNKPRVTYFKKILNAIIQKFPCRILFIQYDKHATEDFLHVTVSSESFDEGKTSFVCDQITISVGGKYIERVPFLVSPHLVPDLPIYLLWGQDPTVEDLVLPHLESYASRLIFDTECTKNLQEFSRKMLQKITDISYDIRDMHWGMTGPWRDVMSQVFNCADRIEQLRTAKTIIIEYNSLEVDYFEHSDRQATYLQAWLAAQLGWEVEKVEKKGDDIVLQYLSGKNTLKLTLRPKVSEDLMTGAILSIVVSDANITKYELRRQESVRKVVVHISTLNECLLPFTLPLPNLVHGVNFMKEIFYETTSQHYQNMLQQLAITNWNSI